MEEVPKHTRLLRRGSVYYHRVKVPLDIKDTYGKTEETFSLGTSDYRAALRIINIKAAEVDRKFDAHRRAQGAANIPPVADLSEEQLQLAKDLYYQFLLEEDQEYRIEGFYEGTQIDTPKDTFEEAQELREDLDRHDRYNQARGKLSAFYIGEAHEVATWEGLECRITSGSPAEVKLARAIQEAAIQARAALCKRDEGEIVVTPKAPLTAKVSSGAPLLSKAVAEWVAEKSRTSWEEKTRIEKEARIEQFLNVVGDKPIDQYTREDARKFKQVLLSVPPNWKKPLIFRGLTMEQAAAKAKELGMKGMKDNTVKKAMNSVSAFWNWASTHYDYIDRNPLKGMNIKVSTTSREEKDPFSLSALQSIFSAPVYTGCLSVRNWKDKGSLVPRDSAIFWVPLMALYTGARMGELLQLYVEDIQEENGVIYLDINDTGEDKKVKTSQSRRKIPLHQGLIKMGFVAFVKKQREKGSKRLFPEVAAGVDGYYSSTFTKHFKRFLESCGVKTAKTSFHSFRHSFEDACRNSGVPSEIMDVLQGHSEKGMKARYGSGYSIEALNRELQKVHYKGLDLGHLYVGLSNTF